MADKKRRPARTPGRQPPRRIDPIMLRLIQMVKRAEAGEPVGELRGYTEKEKQHIKRLAAP